MNSTFVLCSKPPKPVLAKRYGNDDLDINVSSAVLLLSPAPLSKSRISRKQQAQSEHDDSDLSDVEIARCCNKSQIMKSHDRQEIFDLEYSKIESKFDTVSESLLTFNVNVASTPKQLRRTKGVVKMHSTNEQVKTTIRIKRSSKKSASTASTISTSTKNDEVVRMTKRKRSTKQDVQSVCQQTQASTCCCCCCCCNHHHCCTQSQQQSQPQPQQHITNQIQSNRYQLNPIYVNAPSNGYQLIQIIKNDSQKDTKKSTITKAKLNCSVKSKTPNCNAYFKKLVSHKKSKKSSSSTTTSSDKFNLLDNYETNEDFSQKSYIHDTILNDFNQYGQLRIWYV